MPMVLQDLRARPERRGARLPSFLRAKLRQFGLVECAAPPGALTP